MVLVSAMPLGRCLRRPYGPPRSSADKGRMGPRTIVRGDRPADPGPSLGAGLASVGSDASGCQGAPEQRDEHDVHPSAAPICRDPQAVSQQPLGEARAGELTAWIGIKAAGRPDRDQASPCRRCQPPWVWTAARETLAAVGRCGAANAAHHDPALLVEGGTSDAGRQGAAGACAPSRATNGAAGAALLLTLAIVPRFPAGSPRSTPPIVPDGHIQVRLAYGEDGGAMTPRPPAQNAMLTRRRTSRSHSPEQRKTPAPGCPVRALARRSNHVRRQENMWCPGEDSNLHDR